MWTKRVFEDMSKLEHERDVSELKTELQETKNKNRDLQNRVQALYKEIRRVSDSILPQELEIASLRKEKQLLEKNIRMYMTHWKTSFSNFQMFAKFPFMNVETECPCSILNLSHD